MKIFLLTLFVAVLNFGTAFSQGPQGFNYQAVARDNKGDVMANKSVSLRISILDKTATGGVLYSETHSPSTNQFGLFTIVIGNGTPVTSLFSNITWGTDDKYLKVEMDAAGGSNYTVMGVTQLLAVPYAMYAKKSGNPLVGAKGIVVKGDSVTSNISIKGTGMTTVSGSAPNFTIHTDSAVTYTTGTGLSLAGSTFSAQNGTALWNASQMQGNDVSATAPANKQILKWNSSTKKWTPSTDSTTTYTSGAGLDLTGTTFSAQNGTALWNASQMQGVNLSATAPTSNQVLKFNNSTSQWEPGSDDNTTYTNGNGLSLTGTTFSADNTTAMWNSNQLRGYGIAPKTPSNNQVLKWNSGLSEWTPATDTGSSYTAGTGINLSGSAFSAQNTSAMWNANLLQGNSISSAAPVNRQVLRWNAPNKAWEASNDTFSWVRKFTSTYSADSVGIGAAPSGAKLYVKGTVRIDDGTQGAGKVLTSDANGKATWNAPVTFATVTGYAGASIASGATAWVFAGPTTTVTLASSKRVTVSISAPLGATGGTATFEYDAVYQNTSSGTNPVVNFTGGNYSIGQVGAIRTPFTASYSIVLAAGTYKFGFGVLNNSTQALNNNDYVNGWIMMTDQ